MTDQQRTYGTERPGRPGAPGVRDIGRVSQPAPGRTNISQDRDNTPRPTNRPQPQIVPIPGSSQYVRNQSTSVSASGSGGSSLSSPGSYTTPTRSGLLPAAAIASPLSPITPFTSGTSQSALPNALGQMQRTFSHQTSVLQTTSNRHDTELNELRQLVNRAVSRVDVLEQTVTSQVAKIEELTTELQRLRDQRGVESDEEESTPTTKRQRLGISRLVREAVDYCHGCPAPVPLPDCAPGDTDWPKLAKGDGSDGPPAMRWDYNKPFTDKFNVAQQDKLTHVLRHNREALAMPSDFPLTAIPPYDTHANVYRNIISRRFKQLAAKIKLEETRNWATEGRAKVMAEIEELDAIESQDVEVAKTLKEKRDYVRKMDEAGKDLENDATGTVKGPIRSRLQTASTWLPNRRALNPEYSDRKWACMDELFCNVPLTKVKEGDKTLFLTPELEGVYSEEFINARQAIIDTRSPLLSRATGTKPDAYTDLHPGPVPAQPYWATRTQNVHQNPQRWMFDPSWLADHPEEEDAYVVPVDEPTHPEDVKSLDWCVARIGKKRKAAAQTPSDAGGERSRSKTPSRGGSMGPDAKRQKKAVSAVQRVLSDEFDDDYNRERSQTSTSSEAASPEAGPSRYGMTYQQTPDRYRTLEDDRIISPASQPFDDYSQSQPHRNSQPLPLPDQRGQQAATSRQPGQRTLTKSMTTYAPNVTSPLSNSHRADSPVDNISFNDTQHETYNQTQNLPRQQARHQQAHDHTGQANGFGFDSYLGSNDMMGMGGMDANTVFEPAFLEEMKRLGFIPSGQQAQETQRETMGSQENFFPNYIRGADSQ
ncbi:hypothetical protein FFLO_06995 [Filobasidium floriforme]|uniref:Uncharacterized protein n=1 Tax=Filobasidium floriforme TaxID=5210 RepID=A0A8K0NLK8_9TREE|nr:hypothetical protein FFLO_06995 [Filobasidium floriforme]